MGHISWPAPEQDDDSPGRGAATGEPSRYTTFILTTNDGIISFVTCCLLIADANKEIFPWEAGKYHIAEGEPCSALHARRVRLRIQALSDDLDLLGISLIDQGVVQRVTFVTLRRRKRISIKSASRSLGPPDSRIFRYTQSSAIFIVFEMSL